MRKANAVETIPYSQFEVLVDQHKVKEVYITDQFNFRSSSMASILARRSSFSPRPTAPKFSIRRCCAQDASTAKCWWIDPIMAVLLGGRAAEALVFEEVSTGAADDLNRATDIARNMVTRFGMHDKLGQVTYETARQTFLGEDSLAHYAEREFSEETAREIDCAVRELIGTAYDKGLAVLRQNRMALEGGARLLLDKETLTREELPPLAEIRLAAAAEVTL